LEVTGSVFPFWSLLQE